MNNLISKKIGRLTVVERLNKKQNRNYYYLCKCECGNVVEVLSSKLSANKKKSCGCLYKETRHKDNEILKKGKIYKNGVCLNLFSDKISKSNTSGYRGVSKHNKGYRAKITVKGKIYYGKTRKTKLEAYQDRLNLEKELIPK